MFLFHIYLWKNFLFCVELGFVKFLVFFFSFTSLKAIILVCTLLMRYDKILIFALLCVFIPSLWVCSRFSPFISFQWFEYNMSISYWYFSYFGISEFIRSYYYFLLSLIILGKLQSLSLQVSLVLHSLSRLFLRFQYTCQLIWYGSTVLGNSFVLFSLLIPLFTLWFHLHNLFWRISTFPDSFLSVKSTDESPLRYSFL